MENRIKSSFNELLLGIWDFFKELTNLRTGIDVEGTIVSIKNNKRMVGANAWLLMCSIMVASLGLDLNSPAVIIGAMLISPLMSPILGVGLAVGINDRKSLSTSLRHFLVSIAIALVTSTLYFLITPLGEETHEILSRTKPNLLDGLVAVFGGLAGIISATRKDKSNAIPGVAIATALMPPLCVAGYGLAKFNFSIFLNSFYLFFLNSFFIALSTYIIVRLLRFPHKVYVDENEKRKTTIYITIFSILLTIPSGYILYDTWQEVREKQAINDFVKSRFESEGVSLVGWNKIEGDTSMQLFIKLIGEPIDDTILEKYNTEIRALLNENIDIKLYQSTEIPFEDIQRMDEKITGMQGNFSKLLEKSQQATVEKEVAIKDLKTEIDSLKNAIPFAQICKEAKVVFTDLDQLAFAKMQLKDYSTDTLQQIPVLVVNWKKGKTVRETKVDEEKLANFFTVRTQLDTFLVVNK